MIDSELLDYYYGYCELTIWFRKMVLQTNARSYITVKDIASEFISERNRILNYVPPERRITVRKDLNKIATGYYSRIAHWSRTQRITIDMV